MQKRGFFFEVDAAIAMFVLVIGVFIIASYYFAETKITQVEFLSDDLLNLLSNTKIKGLNNPYAGLGGELWRSGEITNIENTLLQQVGEFYIAGKRDTASKFIENVSTNVIPPQYNFELWMDNQSIYPSQLTAAHNASRNSSKLFIGSRKITYGIANKSTAKLWGPYKVEVFVWSAGR